MGGHREAIRDKRRDVRTSKRTQWGTERPEKGHIEGPARALALALALALQCTCVHVYLPLLYRTHIYIELELEVLLPWICVHVSSTSI